MLWRMLESKKSSWQHSCDHVVKTIDASLSDSRMGRHTMLMIE